MLQIGHTLSNLMAYKLCTLAGKIIRFLVNERENRIHSHKSYLDLTKK